MSINQFYQVIVGYGLYAAGGVILAMMFWRYRKVAQTGNKGRMAAETVAPGLMIIASVLVGGMAVKFALPRINATLTSGPIMAAVEAGNVATQALDNALNFDAGTYTTGGFQPMQFSSPQAGGMTFPGGDTRSGVGLPAYSVQMPNTMPQVAPTVVQEPTAIPQTQTISNDGVVNGVYTVKRGDSMYKIAARLLGDGNRYVELCRINVAIVGNSCQLRPGMKISLSGVPAVQRPLVFTQKHDDYQPLVLRSAANNLTQSQPVAPAQVQQVAPTPTAMPLIFMAAMNTPEPTQPAVTIPFVGPTSMPLVLTAAQD